MFKPTRRFAGVARTVAAGLLVGAFALGVSACGGSDDDDQKKDTTAASTADLPEGVALNDEEFKKGADTFFRQCAGCHGTLRVGATGPPLQPKDMQQRGTTVLESIITNGLPGGMPPWGKAGFLTPEEVNIMARFVQMDPPEPPGLDMDEIKESWDLKIPVADRPTAPQTTRNWQNFFGVILRDAGKVAIMDGDTKERVALLNTGYAVHILRSSATGRYFYAIGRDGKVTLIDLWTKKPTTVAEVKGCIDARSVDGSKLKGFEDKYVIEGCYWPMQYVVYDGLTLEPLAVQDVPTESIDGEDLDEVRIAAIAASHSAPVWAVALKESGYVAIVDYSKPDFPITKMIKAQRFLHDGGFDSTGRFFAIAANEKDQIAVIDLKDMERVALIDTGRKPHPGRGANWVDPKYGPVMATTHMGEGKMAIYGADPKNHPQYAWKVVREIKLPSAGTLFLKTHDNSPWVWTDATLATNEKDARSICVYSKQKAKLHKCWVATKDGRGVHFEYNKQGTQVWVSNWTNKGELIIYDDKSLKELKRIREPWLVTPTGKFNVFNTAHDVY
ncbi:MAG TPA: cytochrome D1 domain-containing protein [Miltoncostaeaceae bacterium]|nr:cytochrome D1 domain-containing protein [Miltoncostaeaceae bacterium]